MNGKTRREHVEREITRKQRRIRIAMGLEEADLVLKGATYANVFSHELAKGDIAVADGVIAGIGDYRGKETFDASRGVVCPGLWDAHVHLESSMVSPREFARAVLPHGTTAVIADPHEIANVMGVDGIDYMLRASRGLPLDVYFMLPSCVPATPLDENGAKITRRDIAALLGRGRVLGLGEVMDYEGVVAGDADMLGKISAAQARGMQVDGHAPGLAGRALDAYLSAGIRSDHECTNMEEALEKLRRGQMIMIREGTAAHNLKELLPLLTPPYADRCMFCTDDRHPEELLVKGHIDDIVRTAIAWGADPFLALKAASCNTARHFHISGMGAIAPGYQADLIVVDDLRSFGIRNVFKRGEQICDGTPAAIGAPAVPKRLRSMARETFHMPDVSASDFHADRPLAVIGLVEGQIQTRHMGCAGAVDLDRDIVRAAVIERHRGTGRIGLGMLQGYGLKRGAVATSFAHDAHNLIVVGVDGGDMAAAANRVAQNGGGIAIADGGRILCELALPVAGLLSDRSIEDVDALLREAKRRAFELGVHPGVDPFMTLGFIGLPVIPRLRLLVGGVYDVAKGKYADCDGQI